MTSTAKTLTKDTVPDYVKEHADQLNVFPPDAVLIADAIDGGNVNFSFCVRSSKGGNIGDKGKAVFVKQAPEYVAVFGPDGFPLTSNRIQMEVAILKEWSAILGEEAGKYLPKLYFFDDANKVFVMEFLENYNLLDKHLVATPSLSAELSITKQLATFMAKTHIATHSSKLSPERFAQLTTEYENRALRDIQLEFVFTKAYKEESQTTTKGFVANEAFLKEVNQLKARYNAECGAENMALCHGDLHPGSVMVKIGGEGEEVQVRVFDPEFTIYGPPGLDVGSLFSGYVLAAVHQKFCDEDEEQKKERVTAIRKGVEVAWNTYKEIVLKEGLSEELTREIEVESVGFAVAEVCRTSLGFAGQRLWLQFEDPEVKESAIQCALDIVKKCMVARHEEGMQVLLDCLEALSK